MRLGFGVILLMGLAGCQPSYSPNSYDAKAVQQANKVDQGMVVGVRKIGINANGTTGTVAGAAAGGIAGSQAGPGGPLTAFTALGGTLLGGLVGTSVEHAEGDTEGYEYIIRKANGDLLSVTQKDTTPLAIGQRVLVISGAQARVVPDYTVPVEPAKDAAKSEGAPTKAPPADAPKPPDDAAKPPDAGVKAPIDLKPPPVAAPDVVKDGTSI